MLSVDRPNGTSIDTRTQILEATRTTLLAQGYASLSTRAIADRAGVPLSQIHYHFGSKRQLVLALLEAENEQRLVRQAQMYGADQPLWKQWQQACDFLEDDLTSGYVRVLQEMIAAGWSDDEVAAALRGYLGGWLRLLTDVAERLGRRIGGLGPFTAAEVATIAATSFLGAEATILLGFTEEQMPNRSALRAIGQLLRDLDETAAAGGR